MQDIKKILLSGRKSLIIVDFDLYSDETSCLDDIGAFLKNGSDIIQLKFMKKCDREILSLSKKIRDLTSFFNSLFIIESRADIVKIVGADGLFLNKDDIALNEAKIVLGNEILYGVYFDKNKEIEADFYFVEDSKIIDKQKNFFVQYDKRDTKYPFYLNSLSFNETMEIIKDL